MKAVCNAAPAVLGEESVLTETIETDSGRLVYRLVFARQEPAIWLGHLDMMRTFERAIRRASIPVAWSRGYNPRPQMVFALPISVGLAADADLLDVRCDDAIDPAELKNRLNLYLPLGLRVVSTAQVQSSSKSLMSMVNKAGYRIEAPGIGLAANGLLSGDAALLVEKTRKGKTSIINLRSLILHWNCPSEDQLDVLVMAGSSSNLRPDLLLKLLTQQAGLDEQRAADAEITRTALFLDDDSI